MSLFTRRTACSAKRADNVRPDAISRLFLLWIGWMLRLQARRLARQPVALEPPEAVRAENLARLRKLAGRPSFPMALSSLPLKRVLDIRVPGARELRPARLYIPRGKVKGVVLYFHGGGFVHCGLNSHHGICCRLARASGAAVLSFHYSLAPEHKFPAAVDDCWEAVRWLSGEAWRWGGQMALAGDSAGGTLAAVMS